MASTKVALVTGASSGIGQASAVSLMKAGVPQADGTIRAEPVMDPQHVAAAVVMMATLPLQSNVLSMTIMATKMPFVGRG